MARTVSKLNTAWVTQARNHFLKFLKGTQFPHPERNGQRGSKFTYPEWLVMFVAVLSVKCKVKSYLAIHRMSTTYWGTIASGLNVPPISESQLRDRLKKIRHTPGEPATFIFQVFPPGFFEQEGECG
jgi:hypothetical protein